MSEFKKNCTNCAESYLTYDEAKKSIVRRCKRAYGNKDECVSQEYWMPITEDGFGFGKSSRRDTWAV